MKKLFLISLFLCAINLFARETGKIRGKVIDKSTGKPLPYANVIIKGTTMGAATDLKGEYVIVSVPVGTYTLEASMIGYSTQEVENVTVSVNMTTTVNFEISPIAIREKEVVVKAKRPIIQRDVTATTKIVSGEEITRMPVKDYEEAITLQAGAIETHRPRSGGLHIRGGRSDEVVYIVDGINTTDPVYNVSGAILDKSAIAEMQVISGGFDAEYGRALSGVVNIVTSEGSRKKYSTNIRYESDFVFGAPNLYSPRHTPRIFEQKRYDYGLHLGGITFSGPLPLLKEGTFFTSFKKEQYNSYLPKNNHDEINATLKIAYRWSKSLKTTLSSNYAYRKYYVYSHAFSRGAWLNYLPLRERGNSQINLKIIHNISPKTFYTINIGRFNTFHKITAKDGQSFHEVKGYGQRLAWVRWAVDSGWYDPEQDKWKIDPLTVWRKYYTEKLKLGTYDEQTGKIIWREGVDPEDVMDAYSNMCYDTYTYLLKPKKDIDLNREKIIYSWGDTLFLVKRKFDLDKYIRDIRRFITDTTFPEDSIEPSGDLFMARYNRDEFLRFAYYFPPVWHKRNTLRYSATFQIISQIHEYHELKAGFGCETHYLDLTDVRFINKNPYMDNYHKTPITFDAYISDKIEYEDMVMKLGVRFDWFDPRADFYVRMDSLEAGTARVKPKWQISPRFGISYAVTDKAIMFANYGHFFQPLKFADIYQNLKADITTGWPTIGNPNLPPQKEIMYEGGFKWAFTPDMSIEISAYFKDVKTLLTIRQEQTRFRRKFVSYNYYDLQDFAVVKGIDMTFTKRAPKFLSGSISYSWQSAKGTGSSPEEAFYYYFYYGRTGEPPKREFPLEYDIPHTVKANLNFYLPKEFRILGDLNANLQFTFMSGAPYTPTGAKGQPMELNSKRTPAIHNIDIRIDKGFRFGKTTIKPYVIIKNLLNTKNVVNVYSTTGLPDVPGIPPQWDENYYEIILRDFRRYGYETAREVYEANLENWKRYHKNPLHYGPPRIIQFGLEFAF